MQTLVSFSNDDLERLFLTYKRNMVNYGKIKDKVVGENAEKRYKKSRKSSIFFFIALTFIIVISSSFSLMADHMNSFIALWMIWSIALILFIIWSVFNYRTNYRIIQQNQDFFNKFEEKANQSNSLQDFVKNW